MGAHGAQGLSRVGGGLRLHRATGLRPKAAALGIASTPAGSDDPDGVSHQAALDLIRGAVEGEKARGSSAPPGR